MKKLSDFIELSTIDQKLYWRSPDLENKETFEIQWRKDHPSPWRFRKVGDIFWQIAKGDEVEAAMKQVGIDTTTLQKKIRYSVLQQVAFADKIVNDAREFFGKDMVDQAIQENRDFMTQLEEAVARLSLAPMSPPKPRPKLELVRNS